MEIFAHNVLLIFHLHIPVFFLNFHRSRLSVPKYSLFVVVRFELVVELFELLVFLDKP